MKLSVLELAPVGTGYTAQQALANALELAQLAERLGYERYWFAEHHGMPSIASSAPEILIAHVAAHTHTIRVGSGGIMMQNHVPLKLAEAFHTLEALHPGRIDLGIGRAPGTDPATSRALRPFSPNEFVNQLKELFALSRGELPIRVVPGEVPLPPIWLLGSSGASAQLAGSMGLGYALASHFSPAPAAPAIRAYRESFTPSPQFAEPHAILAVSAIVADTLEEADYLAATGDLMRIRLNRGEFTPIATPEEALAYPYTPLEREIVQQYRRLQFVGTRDLVHAQLEAACEETGANEIMVSTLVHDHAKRMRSYELVGRAFHVP
jgi:luciferase family oxidoreductase group 1